ncbi:MAG: polyamine aminopropyltransferase [Paludibacteraceae bacterium]|nr:polyamine aminopropyltransferase [Paludibacteraceae bacterium]
MSKYKLLMLTTLIISGCSICYELIISALSSFLKGDSVLQYSVTIGIYMSAMGLGSYLSKFVKQNLFNWFVFVEIGVGVIGGLSTLILFLANIYLVCYQIVMYAVILTIGIFVGMEIPLLTRIIENNENNLRVTISSIFSFDYIGGLLGSIAFPLLLLPHLGYFCTAFLIGSLNIIVSLLIILKYKAQLSHYKGVLCTTLCLLGAMIIGTLFSENVSRFVEDGLYRDKVIYLNQTKYQHIVLTRHRDDIRLFINGNIQFSSIDEYRYHEALVHLAMSKAQRKENILVLGGGDGLAAREIFKYNTVKKITLVDLDKDIIRICSENDLISDLNAHSLTNSKMEIINDDAYKFLIDNKLKYDVIIVDLPDPNSEVLNKLYTNVFYRLCKKSLSDEGILVVQSTSPYYATEAFWCINKTIASEGFNVLPYHLEVPTFGDWGFNIASPKTLDTQFHINVPTKFLSDERCQTLFAFAKDELPDGNIKINTLSEPILIKYYGEADKKWK